MFLPLGDDVDNRTLPMAGIFLVIANVLVFLWMVRMLVDHPPAELRRKAGRMSGVVGAIDGFGHSPEIRQFVQSWGLVPRDLQQGRVFGVVTHMFLHGGLLHLVGNMVVLWAFVHTLENALGSWSFLTCYLLWGLLGGLAEAALSWGSEVPLVGASGAIAGMIGAYWVAFGSFTKIRTLIWIFRPRVINIPAGFYVVFWVFSQLQGIIETDPNQPGIAWYAHLGGFAAGALTMVALRGRTARRLVETYHGTLEFREAGQPLGPKEQDPVAAFQATACPYCGSEVDLEHRLADNLARCANPQCQRLVLLEPYAAMGGR